MNQNSQLMSREQAYDAAKAWIFKPEMQLQIQRALPRHLLAQKVSQLFLVEARKTPGLLECTGDSLLGAVMEVSKLGLELGTLGHAWIIPFKVKGVKTATVIVGYKGMLDLAWRSDKIKSVYAHEVLEGDFFEYAFGSEHYVKHIPAAADDRGKITHTYAGCETVAGGRIMDVMDIVDIEKIRQKARSKDKGPWVTDYHPMCVKTVVRKMLKLAPCSTELTKAISLDELGERGDQNLEATLVAIPDDDPNRCAGCGQVANLEESHYMREGKIRCAECGPWTEDV